MYTRATCRHEVRRRSRAFSSGSNSGGGVRTPIGALHDKDSLPPLHFLCKVKQFPGPLWAGCNDYGTRFDLRSKLLLLKQRSLFWLFVGRQLHKAAAKVAGMLYFHEKWRGGKVAASVLRLLRWRVAVLCNSSAAARISYLYPHQES